MNASNPSSESSFPYTTNLDVKYGPLESFALDQLVQQVNVDWFNQTLVRVNDSVVRLGVMQGEYHWHRHALDDEFFFVLSGEFLIDLDPGSDAVTPGRTVRLGEHHGFVVPRGVMHRTRSVLRSVVLMVETAAIIPTGDRL
jgi:mannose-6-phosphate isomerase-like protein (cupin superfamily)